MSLLRRVRVDVLGSLANSVKKLGYEFEWIKDESDFDRAEVNDLLAVAFG